MAGFGDKNMVVVDGWPDGKIVLQGGNSGLVERNGTLKIVFEDADGNLIFAEVFHAEIGQLADSDTGLQKQLNDGRNPDVQVGGVS
ncbi:MAG: hypothetical protein G01um101416_917 [Microgenomates group bacterium Gr01-1014_16]|nr:MAG: hypothetical protein G01um101416_917 [Microgenomates group bacterium Gr01-1014_16]